MLCSGHSGTTIADHWRTFRPLRAISPSPRALRGRSLLTLNRLRDNILPTWQLDWTKINATPIAGHVQCLQLHPAARRGRPRRQHERAAAARRGVAADLVPARHDRRRHLRRRHPRHPHQPAPGPRHGADELWIIWTTSTAGTWRTATSRSTSRSSRRPPTAGIRGWLRHIDASNRLHARGQPSPYGRHITVRLLTAEVPLHYLLNFRQRRFREAVDLGRQRRPQWCDEHDLRPL